MNQPGIPREQRHQQLDALQRRQRRRGILLPFMTVLLLMLGFVGVVFSLQSPQQVAVVSDAMLTLLVLCPLAVCLFPLVIGSLLLVMMMGRWQQRAASPLRRLESWTAAAAVRAEGWLGRIDARVLSWAVGFAPLRHMLGFFDAAPQAGSIESQDEGEQ